MSLLLFYGHPHLSSYSNSYSKIKSKFIIRDAEITAAILEELGYLNEKKEEDKNDEAHDKKSDKDKLENSGEEQK